MTVYHDTRPHSRTNGAVLPSAYCKSVLQEGFASESLREKVSLIEGRSNVLNKNALAIFHSKVRAKPMVANSKVLGVGCESGRISSGKNLHRAIVLKDSANGGNSITISKVALVADVKQQSTNVDKAVHASGESNVLTLHSGQCNQRLDR